MATVTATARHIFVTGQPGVGKTTLVMQAVEQLKSSGVEVQGFYTEEVRDGGRRIGFDVVTMDGMRGPLARVSSSGGPRVGQYAVNLRSFEQLALPRVEPKGGTLPVYVIDEVGKMELFSQGFVQAVRRLLNQPYSTVLGTIPVPKGKAIGLVEEIRTRRDVKVYNLKKKSQHKGVSKVVKAITASLEHHKQLRVNRDHMQGQLVAKVMAQVQASLGEEAIEDTCDQIMADIADDTQRDLCLEVTKATISKLVTKMVAAHLNHQYNKNVTSRQSEITNGQQDQLVSMVLKAVQATLHLQVMKEMHEHLARQEEAKRTVQEAVRDSVEERLQAELEEVVQRVSAEQQQQAASAVAMATEEAAHSSSHQEASSSSNQSSSAHPDGAEVTEVVGLVREALHMQLRIDLHELLVTHILDQYIPEPD